MIFYVLMACWAQVLSAPAETKPDHNAPSQIVLGNSYVPLYGPWKFHTGDSPLDPLTHGLLWADPDFDDSAWETVDLKPQPGWTDPYNGDPRYISGWTSKGHPGYMGYAWYRLRVSAMVKDGGQLALACPIYVDDG